VDKTYDPHAIEQRWYETWESRGYFAPRGTGHAYCIMIPPPNVTGTLHMGHAFQDTIMDALVRYHRMRGHTTLWQAGTDHAGIATQMVVERQLNAERKTRHDLGREGFVERVWEWRSVSGGTITRQLRRMGASLDWATERFTMDEGLSRAVAEVFVRLYEEGLIYRGKRLVNWDPKLHTAVSDLEVVSEEEAGFLWHMRYPLVDGEGHLVVATTRPETLLGDAAVAVHPGDERYRHLIGQLVELPLTGRRIPVIADEYVDPAFGSGCVKITPAHDFNDYQVWLRHRDTTALRAVPQNGLINIFTVDARIKGSELDDRAWGHMGPTPNGVVLADGDGVVGPPTASLMPRPYRGLDRYEARQRIVADLEAQGLLEKTEPHRLMVPRGDRSQAVIEPYLTDQWFVRVGPLAEASIRAVENGRIRFVPESWAKTYHEWMRNIEDWCISRQIWWGHRIPAWYDHAGNVYVGHSEEEVRTRHRLDPALVLTRDPDVLDTWFSSALWPFSTLGWPERTERIATFYPTSVLVTGFDIIFFWVARMIMMGLKFMGDVPFREVYIHGLVRDAEGQKMSKSKGNVLDPLDLIDGIDLESLVAKRTRDLMQPQMARAIERATRAQYPEGIPAYGTDALRFTFCSLATQGRDIRFDLGRVGGYRNFCNKLWNAARYVLMTVTRDAEYGPTGASGAGPAVTGQSGGDPGPGERGHGAVLGPAERWIRSRLARTVLEVRSAVDGYRFDQAAQAIYEFTWNEYCDWYLELSKSVLASGPGQRTGEAPGPEPGGEASADTLAEVEAGSTEAERRGTRQTLIEVLETLLRLAHPLMPFITEEIWQRVAPLAGCSGETVMLEPYPEHDPAAVDGAAEAEMRWVMEVVLAVRRIRGEMNITPGKWLPLMLHHGSSHDRAYLERHRSVVESLARVRPIHWLAEEETPPEAAVALVGVMKVLIPMAGLIDKAVEVSRLGKEIERLRRELERAEAKLANPSFVERAPPDVVDKERQRVAELRTSLAKLEDQRTRVEAL
jgi:valyl-tRNA synthetase